MRKICLAIAVLVATSLQGPGTAHAASAGLEGVAHFDHVVVLTEENESATTTFAPGSPATYLNGLRGKGV
ncbi:MAG: hypothetical protein JWL79_2422, partial [Frankiales bacterium]|nr:hypothetical protein [Frankiales bacterium]